MRHRNKRSRWTCSVCGDELDTLGQWEKVPMWIGLINSAFCERCDRNVTLLRDEQGKFIGTHSGFHSPFTGQEPRRFNNDQLHHSYRAWNVWRGMVADDD